jgi:hypothetical protein
MMKTLGTEYVGWASAHALVAGAICQRPHGPKPILPIEGLVKDVRRVAAARPKALPMAHGQAIGKLRLPPPPGGIQPTTPTTLKRWVAGAMPTLAWACFTNGTRHAYGKGVSMAPTKFG